MSPTDKSPSEPAGNAAGGNDGPRSPSDDQDETPPSDSAGLPAEELARRSGFVPTSAPAAAAASAAPLGPGAYHVAPPSDGASASTGTGLTGLGMPADSVDGDGVRIAAARRLPSRSQPRSASPDMDLSSSGGGVEYVAVAHLVEDAACEPAGTSTSAAAEDGHTHGEGAADRSSVSGLTSSLASEPRRSITTAAATATTTTAAPGAAAGMNSTAGCTRTRSDGGSNGHRPNPNADNAHDGPAAGITNNGDVVIAEKLDSRSISLCGRHGRFQRWHGVVLGGLLLVVCVVVPVAVVLTGTGGTGRTANSTSSQQGADTNGNNGNNGGTWDGSGTGSGNSVGGGSPQLQVLDWTQPGLLESIVFPSVSDPSTLEDASSPQSRAWQWLTEGGGANVVAGPDVPSVEWRIRQRYALAVLYYSTAGDRWKRQYGFLNATAAHECEWGSEMLNNGWTALECNGSGEVTLINLWQNNLAGPLPGRELGRALKSLTALDFLTNRLTGTVPVDLTTLPSLNYLNLGYNRLTGTVPPELGNLDQITYLMMDWNDLTGTIPPELGGLVQLSGWLSLEGNQLTGTVPRSFADLTQATWIYLNNNDLVGSAEFLCGALQPVEGPGYTHDNSTSALLELWVDVDEVNCTCCNCCPFYDP